MSTHLISAVLIVKNEQGHLPACLAALDGVVDEIVVVDTGSTDRSVEVAEGFTERVFRVPWTGDFAAARNAAIAHARGAWILSVDADECIEGGEAAGAALRRFVETHGAETVGTVAIHNVDDGDGVIDETIDHTERFFHKDHFQFFGAIHEQLVPISGVKRGATTGIHLIHTGYAQRPGDPAHKSRRNLPLLLDALARHPDDEYLYFQLGKAHFALKDYGLAVDAFLAALSRMRFNGSELPTGRQGTVSRVVTTGCLTNTAYALVNLGRAQEAQRLLEQHATLAHPGAQWADFQHALGYVYLMLGEVPRARAAYEAALARGSEREDVVGTGSFASLYHLGLLDEAEGKNPEAEGHYAAALAQRPAYRPAISRAIDWLLEGQAPSGHRLIARAAPEAAQALYLDRLERSLQNGASKEVRGLVAAADVLPGPLRDAVAAWAGKNNH